MCSSFYDRKWAVHLALCDNMDTRSAMEEMRLLVGLSNSYIASRKSAKLRPNRLLLESVASYLTAMMKVMMMMMTEEDGESANQDGHLINSFLVHWSKNKIAKMKMRENDFKSSYLLIE